jgi:hypothetical protein
MLTNAGQTQEMLTWLDGYLNGTAMLEDCPEPATLVPDDTAWHTYVHEGAAEYKIMLSRVTNKNTGRYCMFGRSSSFGVFVTRVLGGE